MANQVAINVHTRPGDEVICHKLSHVYYYEGGGIARNSGVSVCLLEGERGLISSRDVEEHINPDDIHRPVTTLVEAENTMNKGGGAVYDFMELERIAEVCKRRGLKFHLDGARLFNAMAERGETSLQYGKLFDSISICLSKGLGAPVGSVVTGDNAFIKKARRVRKVFGGAMRQAGYLAAAGIYALDHHIDRLKEDHVRARALAEVLSKLPYVESILPVESNILIFTLAPIVSEKVFLKQLREHDIHAFSLSPRMIRFVTHLDYTDEMLGRTISILKQIKY
jgi:threonine aldolase